MKYCVIGSGIGGGILAKKIAKKNTHSEVLLIDAGGEKSTSNVTIDNVGLPFGLRATTAIELGGTTNLWHGVLSKLDPIDFEKRDWIPNSGWPILLSDLEPYYKESAAIFNVKKYAFFEQNGLPKDLSKKLQDISFDRTIFENKLFQQPLPTLRLKKELIEAERSLTNLTILSNTTVLKLEFKKKSNEVQKIIVGKEDGKTDEIVADIFIICAGALETPRLLLNSKIDNKNIGKFLMDHPMGNLCQLEFKKPHKAHLYSDMKYHPNNKIKTGLLFLKETQKKHQLLNHNFYLRPSFKKGINNESETVKLAFLTFLSGKISIKDVWKLLKNFNVILQILAYKFTLNFTYKFTDLFFVTEQIPNEKSTVSLSHKTDKWGYPIAKVDWQLTKQDFNSLSDSFKLIHKGFSPEDFNFIHQEKDLIWNEIYTSAAHHVGTARMSENKNSGVVDKNLKVHNIDNLYICDGSVFTTSGNVNSGFTIAALACRLANHFKEKE